MVLKNPLGLGSNASDFLYFGLGIVRVRLIILCFSSVLVVLILLP